jgi:hypothetical protein
MRQRSFLKPATDDRRDTRSGGSIAKRKDAAAHRCARDGIAQHAPNLRNDSTLVGANKPRCASGEPFGPFGLVAEHQQGDAERRCLLLDAAGIAEDEVGLHHSPQHRLMAARLKKSDASDASKQPAHRRGDEVVGVQHDIGIESTIAGKLGKRRGNRRKAVKPALAAVARHQNSRRRAVTGFSRRQPRRALEHRINARIARYVNFARDPLCAKVCRGKIRRREQQVGVSIDGGAIFLFRPGQHAVVRAEPGFDMPDRRGRGEGRKRGAECAGRVALDDHEIGGISEERGKGHRHRADMRVRVLLSSTAKIGPLKPIETKLGWIQSRVLTGENEGRRYPLGCERVRDG